MTDRVNGLVVTLDRDMRVDDVEILVNAIRLMKYVKSVDNLVTNPSKWVTEHQIRLNLADRLKKIEKELINGSNI